MLSIQSLLCVLVLCVQAMCYDVLRDYSGQNFFQGWDFYGYYDNLTLGDVNWLNSQDASSQGLAYINGVGNAILKVDNTTNVPFNQKRNSVRITTQDFYTFGSLWIIDAVHLPYGCSVWPAFWSKGLNWPYGGEIDIIEGINLMSANQMALHTTPGCTHTTPSDQTGTSGTGSSAADCSTGEGCVVREKQPNSFGSAFAAGGGGVWATQYDIAGIFMWYWNRPNIPASITQSTSTSSIDLSDWGPPSASYPSVSCNMANFFTDQQLVFDITLCGDWAGTGQAYNASCGSSGPTGLCYNNNVVGPGSPTYDNAYFEVSYVRAYTTVNAATALANIAPTATPTTDTTGGPSAAITPLADSSQTATSPNAAVERHRGDLFLWVWMLCALFGMVLIW